MPSYSLRFLISVSTLFHAADLDPVPANFKNESMDIIPLRLPPTINTLATFIPYKAYMLV